MNRTEQAPASRFWQGGGPRAAEATKRSLSRAAARLDEPWARWIAVALFLLAAAFEVGRIVADRPWPGLDPTNSDVTGGLLAALWTAAAVALATKATRRRPLAILVVLAVFSFLPHGVVSRIGGSWWGAAFIVAAPLMAGLVWIALRGRPRLGTPTTDLPERPGFDASSIY